MAATNPIHIVKTRMPREQLAALLGNPFPDMIKFVVDIQTKTIAVGGAMHVDAEAELLERGSVQEHLWGGNYYPGTNPESCVEFTSLINIRPAQGSRSMEVVDPLVRRRMLEIVHALVGKGEALK